MSEAIDLPRNSMCGPVFGAASLALGFAMVWHIWWLAGLTGLILLMTIIVRSFDDDSEYCLSAAEVAQIEGLRYNGQPLTNAGEPTNPDIVLPGAES